jgi:competence protein ComEA
MKLLKSIIICCTLGLTTTISAIACEKVNVNTADANELDRKLDGIGEKKAESIITHREKNGNFKDADDLDDVIGIGPKTIEKNRECIVIEEEPKEAIEEEPKEAIEEEPTK